MAKGKLHANIPLGVLHSESVTALSHAEFRVLVLLAGQYHGRNNGNLGITKSDAEVHRIAGRTLYRAFRTLMANELIEITYPASRVPPRPTKYALTWWKIDETPWSMETRTPARIFRWKK